jgi:hypothetical protein
MIMKSLATMAFVAVGFLPVARAATPRIAEGNTRLFLHGRTLRPRRRPGAEGRRSAIILAAARAWCSARETAGAIQPALYRTLKPYGCGVLAPVFASLFAVYECTSGNSIEAGAPESPGLTAGEADLLGLLDEDPRRWAPSAGAGDDRLSGLMRIAIRSSRIMLRLALEIA